MSLLDWLADLLAGGKRRRLQHALTYLQSTFAFAAPDEEARDRAADAYRRALLLAVRIEPAQAVFLFRSYDSRIPADNYVRAFRPADTAWLAGLRSDDPNVLTIALEVAGRLGLGTVQREAAERLATVLGRGGEANRLVLHLLRCQQLSLLTPDTLSRALRDHLTRSCLERDALLWRPFFDGLPEALLPPLFEVHHFLGRGADVVRLADAPARQHEALACCRSSPRLGDVNAGLDLARRLGDADAVRRLQEHAGDLLFDSGKFDEALEPYREAGRLDRVSECHERLGQLFEALAACPAERVDRLASLARMCQPAVDALVERKEFVEAARQAQGLVEHLGRAVDPTEAVTIRRAEAAGLRAGVLAAGRQHFSRLAQQTAPSGQRAVYQEWSRFEEEASEWTRAALRAEDADDRYRAHRLFRQAGLFGDAVRVLEVEATPEGLASRAEARADGGDLAGAARLYELAGQPDKAAHLFQQGGEFAAAARCLRKVHGDEAIEAPQMFDCLRRAGALDELIDLCVQAVGRKGRRTRAVDWLRRLLDAADAALPPEGAAAARAALDRLGAQGRRAFEERAAVWVAQARAEVDRRYAGIWGFDLGTTTCSAAIYDTETRQSVLCPWKGRNQFASTLSLDEQGNEVVGLAGEEIFAHGLVGHIGASKRKIGSHAVYRIRDRSYRPEEVAARLIRHARGLVEGFLTVRVRERVGELARAELGNVPDDWLNWADHEHDLRLPRARLVATIPAFFLNNQKHATRDACQIAGVEVVRLIHEPTAACMAAGRERRLTGRVVVVDLGAGTLDVSFLDVAEGIYDVQQVLGDTQYGGKDFDAVIAQALADRLKRQGIEMPEGGLPRRRLEVAAEYLKIELSSQKEAAFLLRAFVDGKDVNLELSRADLEQMLAEALGTLRRTCADFKKSLKDRPQHLVLVGGPMLSSLVYRQVEEVFGMTRTMLEDPRTAVACGAALQAAVLDGKLKETLLLDVAPLSLGIRAFDQQEHEHFSMLIDRNTHIPVEKRQIYSTKKDNQPAVDVEVFQGRLDAQSRIGHFKLVGIRSAKKGEPQIEVTFAIDASCVLQVTARDKQTGASNSIRLTDTTLLSPSERDAMAQRFQQQQEQENQRRELRDLVDDLARQVADVTGSESESLVREWRSRLAAYRPSGAPLDDSTQKALFEMFNQGNEMESELLLAEAPLRDLAIKAREYLERTDKPGAAAAPQATADALAEGQHLAAELARRLDRLRPLRTRLTAWNAVLVKLATAETDPLRRFLACYEAGDYARALEALSAAPAPLDHPPHIFKQLDCLGRVGDAAGYRRVLSCHAGRLHVVPIDPAQPDLFLARAWPALVRVQVRRADGPPGIGSGFLLSHRMAAVNQRWLVEEAEGRRTPIDLDRVEVILGNGPRRVERIFLSRSPQGDVALLRLAEPVKAAPFRLGHANLVRIGDQVWTAAPNLGSSGVLLSGVVHRFESFPEWNIRLFKVGLRAPAQCSGGPLLNDFGEVVGILTIKEREGEPAVEETCYAQTADSLEPLLAAAGLGRWPMSAGPEDV